jgi:hypothetical protein
MHEAFAKDVITASGDNLRQANILPKGQLKVEVDVLRSQNKRWRVESAIKRGDFEVKFNERICVISPSPELPIACIGTLKNSFRREKKKKKKKKKKKLV